MMLDEFREWLRTPDAERFLDRVVEKRVEQGEAIDILACFEIPWTKDGVAVAGSEIDEAIEEREHLKRSCDDLMLNPDSFLAAGVYPPSDEGRELILDRVARGWKYDVLWYTWMIDKMELTL